MGETLGQRETGEESSSTADSSVDIPELDIIQFDKLLTLRSIVDEIRRPCRSDLNQLQPYSPLSDSARANELFKLITGLSHDFHKQSPILAVEVYRIRDTDMDNPKALVKLDCGLMGTIFADSFDDYNSGSLREAKDGSGKMVPAKSNSWKFDDLCENAVIYVLAVDVNAKYFKVTLTAKQSEIDKWNRTTHRPIGYWPFYREPEQNAAETNGSSSSILTWDGAAAANSTSSTSSFTTRITSEKVFVNKSKADVIRMFEQEGWDIGHACFRPSSMGTHLVKATVKFFEDLYADYNIFEDGKEFANPDKPTLAEKRKIGSKLTVGYPRGKDPSLPAPKEDGGDQEGQHVYDSLEELQFSYFRDLIDIAEQVPAHRKYLEGGRVKVESQCFRDKEVNPHCFPYYLCVSTNHPGFFELGYVSPSRKFRYLYIQPVLEGLKCAGVLYNGSKAINAIISEFKKGPKQMYARAAKEKQKYMMEEKRRQAAAKRKEEAERAAKESRRRDLQPPMHSDPRYPERYGGQYGGGGYGGPGPQSWQQPAPYGGYSGGGAAPPPYGGGYGGGYGGPPPQQWQQQRPPPLPQGQGYAPPPVPQQQWGHAGAAGGYGGY